MLRRWMLLRMKLTERQLNDIVQEEIYTYLIQEAWSYSQFGKNSDGSERTQEEWAKDVLANPMKYTREDVYDAEALEKEGFPAHRDEFHRQQEPAPVSSMLKDTPNDLAQIANSWEQFINNTSRENIPQAIQTLKADGRLAGKYQGQTILPILKTLYDKLRKYDEHPM